MSELIERARAFAIAAHDGIEQKRRYTGDPYWHHCREVVDILTTRASTIVTLEMIAAAWLHDTIEDTPATLGEIFLSFGETVANLVENLTDPSALSDGNREARRAIDRAHSAQASAQAQTIKLCDLISNTRSIVAHDPGFAETYLREKILLLDVLTKGDRKLWKKAETLAVDGLAQLGSARLEAWLAGRPHAA